MQEFGIPFHTIPTTATGISLLIPVYHHLPKFNELELRNLTKKECELSQCASSYGYLFKNVDLKHSKTTQMKLLSHIEKTDLYLLFRNWSKDSVGERDTSAY